MKAYIGFPNAMNMHIRERMKDPRSNPFLFKHVSELRSAAHLDDSGPSVVLASPGMLQNSTSRELFEMWCTDARNGVIIAGYSVAGTLAKEITTESVDKIDTMGGQKLPLRMSVESISFAAHVDYVQNRDFVRSTGASKVILVHGEQNEMLRFKTSFERHFENDTEYHFRMYNPENLEQLAFFFRGEKMAKVIGQACANIRDAAGATATEGDDGAAEGGGRRKRGALRGTVISGLLVNPVSTLNYHIYDPSELTEHTGLKTSQLVQRQVVVFPHGFGFLHHFMQLMHGTAVSVAPGRETLAVMDKIKMIHDGEARTVTLEWVASAENDMWADSVLATILHIEDSPASIKVSQKHAHHGCGHEHDEGHGHDQSAADSVAEGRDDGDETAAPMEEEGEPGTAADAAASESADAGDAESHALGTDKFVTRLSAFLGEHFGACAVDEGGNVVTVSVDATEATIRLARPEGPPIDGAVIPTMIVESSDTYLQQSVTRACERFRRMAEPHVVV